MTTHCYDIRFGQENSILYYKNMTRAVVYKNCTMYVFSSLFLYNFIYLKKCQVLDLYFFKWTTSKGQLDDLADYSKTKHKLLITKLDDV